MTNVQTPASRAQSRADRIRPWAVLAAIPVTLAMAGIGGGAIGGFEVQNASGGALSATATPLAPAGPAFSIWSVIYLGLLLFAVWQVLPSNRGNRRVRAIGWLAVASLVLNALWIIAAIAGLLPLTVVIILALLVVVALIVEILRRHRPDGPLEAVVVDGTFGLYLGWVSVATIANISALLADWGVRPAAWEVWAIVMLVVAAIVAGAIALRTGGRIAPSLAMIWGVAWIGVGRLTTEPASFAIGVAAALVCVAIGAMTVAARLGRGTQAATL